MLGVNAPLRRLLLPLAGPPTIRLAGRSRSRESHCDRRTLHKLLFSNRSVATSQTGMAMEPDHRSSRRKGFFRMQVDRRREPRVESNLPVLIWGIDARGLPFAQKALARNISGQGALLSGIEQLLRCGDLMVVQYGKKRARFRVVWTRDSANGEKVRAAVQRLEAEECPWKEELQLTSAKPRDTVDRPIKVPDGTRPVATGD
jgi:hypothetical protein